MPSEGLGQPGEATDRVARGFEALVDEEPLLSRPPVSGVHGPGTGTDLARLDVLEQRVRVTMDRLTELVEAQLPEAVDGLRADFEQLRTDVHAALVDAHQNAQVALAEAAQQLADERRQLRSQIATTVGAANRWFVRTRDQLYERLDQIAAMAAQAQPRAEVAAADGAAVEPAPAYPELEAVPEDQAEQAGVALEWDVEEPLAPLEAEQPQQPVTDQAVTEQSVAQPAVVEQPVADEPYVAPAVDGDMAQPVPTPVVLDAPELETLVAPLRDDIQELQGEVSAMAEAMFQLREDFEHLSQRVPLRAPAARLAPRQIDAIVQAVREALPVRAPVRRAPATRATATTRRRTATGATTAKAARKAVTAKKAATAAAATRAAATRATRAVKVTKATKATKGAKAVKRTTATSAARGPRIARPPARY